MCSWVSLDQQLGGRNLDGTLGVSQMARAWRHHTHRLYKPERRLREAVNHKLNLKPMRGWWGFGVEGQTAWRILTSKLPCHSLSHHKLVPSALRGVGSITLVAKCPWLILHELPMPFRAGTIFFFHLSGEKSTTIELCSDKAVLEKPNWFSSVAQWDTTM